MALISPMFILTKFDIDSEHIATPFLYVATHILPNWSRYKCLQVISGNDDSSPFTFVNCRHSFDLKSNTSTP